jgi:hypothetical protein
MNKRKQYQAGQAMALPIAVLVILAAAVLLLEQCASVVLVVTAG